MVPETDLADAAPDAPVDPVEAADATIAADAPEVPDPADAADATDAASAADAADTADVPDVPPPFTWAAGCEAPGTGATWTPIPDGTFLRGPLVQLADRDRATIVWRTATPSAAEGCVDASWGDATATACGPADANGQYEVRLEGLPPATEVGYVARVGDLRTARLSFRTLPDRPVPLRFAVFADAHSNIPNLQKMSTIALAEGVDFAVAVGDLTGSGQVEEFDATFQGFRDLGTRVNVWAVIGNHDEKNMSAYFDAFVLPEGNAGEASAGLGEGYWARRMGNVWIGGGWIRDYYLSSPDATWGQAGWFREQFKTAEFQTAQWRLFFIHEPPWVASGGGDCDYYGETSLRASLMPLLVEGGIQASFHGHMHGLEWGVVDGVHTYVGGGLSGGGMDEGTCPAPEGLPQPWSTLYGVPGFAIVETGCDRLLVRFLDLDGKEIGRDEIPAGPG
jgi:hypothetical protein